MIASDSGESLLMDEEPKSEIRELRSKVDKLVDVISRQHEVSPVSSGRPGDPG